MIFNNIIMIINLFYKLQINFIKYFTILFISILITSPIYSQKLSSKAYKVAYMDKGNTITSKNTGKIFPIASLVKLPLVLIADDYFQKEDYIKVPSIKLIYYKPESRANILVGEEYKYSDLLYGLLLPSGNDIARVLEHELKSKGKNFTDLASNWIKKNSLEYTSIKEPIGLSSATSSNI
ncbi:MAG: hypothetical protein KDK36_09960, partial [Leptospiraceae bacterium]|nr:hypothetical protein [Leptospiraceae bacterium]